MHVLNVLHAARCKYRTQIIVKNLPSGHHRATLSGYVFATEARIDNRKKNLLSSNISSTCPPQYGELRPTSGWDRSGSLGHPSKFQRGLGLGSVTGTARYSSSGRQPNFAALNTRRHLYSAVRPSHSASAHILVSTSFCVEQHTSFKWQSIQNSCLQTPVTHSSAVSLENIASFHCLLSD